MLILSIKFHHSQNDIKSDQISKLFFREQQKRAKYAIHTHWLTDDDKHNDFMWAWNSTEKINRLIELSRSN